MSSASGEGLFTTGISGFAFVTLDMVAAPERASAIYQSAVDAVNALEKNGAPPGRVEQDRILLARLEPGGAGRSPGCEIINFPGYIPGGGPSGWFANVWRVSMLTMDGGRSS